MGDRGLLECEAVSDDPVPSAAGVRGRRGPSGCLHLRVALAIPKALQLVGDPRHHRTHYIQVLS